MSHELKIDPYRPETYPRTTFFTDNEFWFCYADTLRRLLKNLPESTILDFSYPGFAIMSRDIEMSSGYVRPRMYSGVIDLMAGEIYFFHGDYTKYGTDLDDQIKGTIHERFYTRAVPRYQAEIPHQWARLSVKAPEREVDGVDASTV